MVLVQNWCKMTHLPQQRGSLSEISYIPLLSVVTFHSHRLYEISSLEPEV